MKYKNLTIIGTSHISKESIKEVSAKIIELKPVIIAIELDKPRLSALLNQKRPKTKVKDLRKIGFGGLFFNIIGGWIEKKLGKIVDTKPGSEMLAAIKLAKKENIPIALIDQDIRITLQRISKNISWKEKFRLLSDLIVGSISKKQEVKIDLEKVPEKEVIEQLTKEFGKRYPGLYKVLVTERNKVMAKGLNKLLTRYKEGEILAIIGAGHEEEIIELLKNE